MRALIVDRGSDGGLVFADVPEPVPADNEAIVAVRAISLNRGEVVRRDAVAGTVPGWDAAGVVVTAAADGSTPPAGTRVVTMRKMGGFAERRVARAAEMAVIPDGVRDTDAVALPVAGVTGLGAVRSIGPAIGATVLVTGAGGGVGRFATQLAHRAGAFVICAVGSAARADGLVALGADEVVVGTAGVRDGLDAALDTVGGPTLIDAWNRLRPGGIVVSIGRAAREDTVFLAYDTPMRDNLRLLCYNHEGPVTEDLGYLLSLVAAGDLDTQVSFTAPWERYAEAVGLLMGRRLNGKAALTLT